MSQTRLSTNVARVEWCFQDWLDPGPILLSWAAMAELGPAETMATLTSLANPFVS